MAYSKYYPNGWKSGEVGNTPITPEALNNMEAGIEAALTSGDVVNNLTSTNTDKPLSANMGKTLEEHIQQSTAFMRVLGTYTGTTGKSTFVFQNVARKNWLVICNMNLYVANWSSAQNLTLYNAISGAAATNYTITGDYTIEINGLQWYDNPWAISLS